jgi:hypothetical protein
MSRRKYYFSQKPFEAQKRGEISGSSRGAAALPDRRGFYPPRLVFVIFLWEKALSC